MIWGPTRYLLKIAAPLESVFRTEDAAHPDAVILGGAARVADYYDVVAGLQRLARDAGHLAGRRPFDRPALHLTLVVGRFDVDERVRVAEHERHHVPFDLDLLVDDVRGSEGMMGVRRRSRDENRADETEQKTFHDSSCETLREW